ncbi:MAG TPA: 4-(cytidine 5'-diphospho)-2-C-methyl-D-erythritol kinase [Candidatus Limnocylindria bacterium]
MSRSVTLAAPAKLNLALAVTGKRSDGYHDLRSVFVRMDLADDVRVARHARLEVRNTMRFEGEDLAARAVRALAEAARREAHAFVSIRKRIPIAAGLGGGSSDAAAVLRALASLWEVDADLVRVAAEVGSDVPFFASGASAALVSGRGEIVAPLPQQREPLHVVLVRPTVRLSTRDVFDALRADEHGDATHVDAIASAFTNGVVTPDLVRVHAVNDLLGPAERICDAISSWRAVAAARGIALFLSGSGPSLFAVADDRADSLRIARILRRSGLRARPQVVGL